MKNTRPETPAGIPAHEYKVIAPLIMAAGIGNGRETACLVAQAATIDALRKGETLDAPTDRLECACPILRRMAINANDASWWKDNAERTEHLRPLIPLLLDSRGSLELTKRRAAHTTNAVIHQLTPMRLEWIAANTKNEELKASIAKGIKAISEIELVSDKASALKARDALSGLRSSAYASASAYAYASASAYADASASADASAYASASAYAYADASADADADAYAQKLKYRNAYLALFREVAAIKD